MKGDFTKFNYKPRKEFNRVYKQQGRAELDADFNEYVDLTTDLNRTEAIDVIGKTGIPKGDDFKVEIINDNTDLLIRKGHMYVDGILCRLEDDVHYLSQPNDLPQPALKPTLDNKDLVYLHVMERHITWVEDPSLLEPALQGADTCTRVKTIAQVRVQTVPRDSTCDAVPNWPPAPSAGRLTTGIKLVDPAPNPCTLPESGGFRGTENRLYRVEVHTGGSLNKATFKWSCNNGAVVSPIEFIGETHRVKAKTLGRDQILRLKKSDWVELASDSTDLTMSAGTLAQIVDITPDLIIQLNKDISAHHGQTHPKLRLWDQGSDEVSMQSGTTLDLEDGITLKFSGSNFQSGDAWMFTARVGLGIEQLVDEPPSSVVHHYAPLALITWVADTNNVNLLQGQIELCALPFPPLTNITADDVKFDGSTCQFEPNIKTVQQAIDVLCENDKSREEKCCTIVVRPGPNWADAFKTIPAIGAHLCFCPNPDGYHIAKRIVIQSRGAIVISGIGDAAKIIANDDECALRFINCGSVSIRNLSAEAKVAQIGSKMNSSDGILGVISIKNATDIVIENCELKSANGPHRTTACLSVHGANRAAIHGNRFIAGVQQVGLLLSDVNNVKVDGNLIAGTPRAVKSLSALINDQQYLAGIRKKLVANISIGVPATSKVNVTSSVGGLQVHFLAPDSHIQQWKNLLQQNSLPGNPSIANIEDHILSLANRILLENPFPSFSDIRATIFNYIVPSGQGITVGGTIAENVVVVNNRVTGFMQGIHVGLSASNPNIYFTERVHILENQVSITLGVGATRDSHGIYLGNCDSSNICCNLLTLVRSPGTQNILIDGIRVFGRLGRLSIIRENHLTGGFNTGIRFELRGSMPREPMWLIKDNLAEGAKIPVYAPNVAVKNISNNLD